MGGRDCYSCFTISQELQCLWKESHTTRKARAGARWVQECSVCAAPSVHHRVPLRVAGAAGETRLEGPAALACGGAAAGVARKSVQVNRYTIGEVTSCLDLCTRKEGCQE